MFDGYDGAYVLRYRLALFAAPTVDDAGQEVFRRVRGVRDSLADGGWQSPLTEEARDAYWVAFEELTARMRREVLAD